MLNYRWYGENTDTPPLVVLHGLLGSLENWHSFANTQAAQRRVLTVDLRNHGRSPHVSGMSYREMVADVLAVLAQEARTAVDLIGHSMGGKVAMLLALQQPESVHRLIVVDIAPKAYPPRHQALLQTLLAMPLATFSTRQQADAWLAATVTDPLERGFLLKNLTRIPQGQFAWQCNLREIARHYLNIANFPAIEQHYPYPALFISGKQSDYVQDADIPNILRYFPAAQHHAIIEAGHLPHVQTPAAFTRLVEAFLA